MPTTDLTDNPGGEPSEARGALRTGSETLRALLRSVADTVLVVDEHGAIVFMAGNHVGATLGYPDSDFVGAFAWDLVHPDDLPRVHELFAAVLAAPGAEAVGEVRLKAADGSWQYIEGVGLNLLHDPDVNGVVLTTRNVTERKRTAMLFAGQARVLQLVALGAPLSATLEEAVLMVEEQTGEGIAALYLHRPDGSLELAAAPSPSEAMRERFRTVPLPPGASLGVSGEVVALDVDEMGLSADQVRALRAAGYHACWTVPVTERSTGDVLGVFCAVLRSQRFPTPAEAQALRTAADLTAIAIERNRDAERLAHRALHDTLTGLPNRVLLRDRLEQAIRRVERHAGTVAVLFLDLDRFKIVNDSLGHTAGDEILVAAAGRVRAAVRPQDTIARFGGDEFVVVCEEVAGPDEARRVAGRLTAALAEPFTLGEGTVVLEASVGIALAASPDADPDELLRDADAAMYRAKERGRNRCEVFDEAMRAQAVTRLRLESELRLAVERGEFAVHYQPTVDLASGEVVAAEALVRWDHPERGLLPPSEFIAVAEEMGLVSAVGDLVLDRALHDLMAWTAATGDHRLRVAVNLSARCFSTPDLVDRVERALVRHRCDPSRLTLELTESILMDDADAAQESLLALGRLGVRVALDDFGTGYSSLGYLHRLPVSEVKIDRSFISGASESSRDGTIVTAVVRMAEALGLASVAEGVETEAQAEFLRRRGCTYAQGYLFSEPVDAAGLARLLAEGVAHRARGIP